MIIKEETKLFKKKYRIPSARLPGYNYANTGLYFVTICVKNRECVFGQVRQGMMELTTLGEIVRQCWLNVPGHFKNFFPGEFIVMPNHFHGIVSIDNQAHEKKCRDGACPVSTDKKNSLADVVGSFKSACTKRLRQIDSNFTWQPRFHDHIIRNEKSLEEIRQYILKNPEKWLEDDLYERPLPKIQK